MNSQPPLPFSFGFSPEAVEVLKWAAILGAIAYFLYWFDKRRL
jgi:hypothetical protein